MSEQRLELHYHLRDGSHSMDALLRNRCEAEALAAIQHIAGELGIDVVLESTVFTEGGLREVWKFISTPKNTAALTVVLGSTTLLALLVQIVIQVWALPAAPDKEQEALTKELTKLSIEEKKLSIQKMKQDVDKGMPVPEAVAPVIAQFCSDYKVVTRRSNFYKLLIPYDKVTAVGYSNVSEGQSMPERERVVSSIDFPRFVILDSRLTDLVDENAVIEIVAPVITGGNMHWKGIYQGEPISFAMRDREFKDSVASRQVSFQHGDSITCVLNTERKLDAVGEVLITGRFVALVLEKTTGTGQAIATKQGRTKRHDDKLRDAQRDLLASLDD